MLLMPLQAMNLKKAQIQSPIVKKNIQYTHSCVYILTGQISCNIYCLLLFLLTEDVFTLTYPEEQCSLNPNYHAGLTAIMHTHTHIRVIQKSQLCKCSLHKFYFVKLFLSNIGTNFQEISFNFRGLTKRYLLPTQETERILIFVFLSHSIAPPILYESRITDSIIILPPCLLEQGNEVELFHLSLYSSATTLFYQLHLGQSREVSMVIRHEAEKVLFLLFILGQ